MAVAEIGMGDRDQKEEGRGKREEGRGKKEEGFILSRIEGKCSKINGFNN
ncbi:hypothetical protein PN499_17265 [Kamptonema animale CS-326]|jgi:hypothetical protein|nr:hypothetical protein [Kamptonema animale]MDB9512943.1 hypothetical protein [Kamptonema animale CS-326]